MSFESYKRNATDLPIFSNRGPSEQITVIVMVLILENYVPNFWKSLSQLTVLNRIVAKIKIKPRFNKSKNDLISAFP